jgi:hypothetical protein
MAGATRRAGGTSPLERDERAPECRALIARRRVETAARSRDPRDDIDRRDSMRKRSQRARRRPSRDVLARVKCDSARRHSSKKIEKFFKSLFIEGAERFAAVSIETADRVK